MAALGWLLNLDYALGTTGLVTVPNVVGETQAQGRTDITGVGLVTSVTTAYSDTIAIGLIISQVPVGGSSALPGDTVAIVVSLGPQPAQSTFTGGFVVAYELEQARRRATRKKREQLEEEAEAIEEDTTRAIAHLLREQEALDDRRAELQRLSTLVAHYADREAESALADRVQKAIKTAAAKQTAWALFHLEREIKRAEEEEQFILDALMIWIEHE